MTHAEYAGSMNPIQHQQMMKSQRRRTRIALVVGVALVLLLNVVLGYFAYAYGHHLWPYQSSEQFDSSASH